MARWGIAKAKAQFSEVVHAAEKHGPQTVLRSGREVAVLISIDEWKTIAAGKQRREDKPVESLADFILNSPLHGLQIPRTKLRRRAAL